MRYNGSKWELYRSAWSMQWISHNKNFTILFLYQHTVGGLDSGLHKRGIFSPLPYENRRWNLMNVCASRSAFTLSGNTACAEQLLYTSHKTGKARLPAFITHTIQAGSRNASRSLNFSSLVSVCVCVWLSATPFAPHTLTDTAMLCLEAAMAVCIRLVWSDQASRLPRSHYIGSTAGPS